MIVLAEPKKSNYKATSKICFLNFPSLTLHFLNVFLARTMFSFE